MPTVDGKETASESRISDPWFEMSIALDNGSRRQPCEPIAWAQTDCWLRHQLDFTDSQQFNSAALTLSISAIAV